MKCGSYNKLNRQQSTETRQVPKVKVSDFTITSYNIRFQRDFVGLNKFHEISFHELTDFLSTLKLSVITPQDFTISDS